MGLILGIRFLFFVPIYKHLFICLEEIVMSVEYKNLCVLCGDHVLYARWKLGYKTCLVCGEKSARKQVHCIVPMPKSNYIVVTDPALLQGLNSSHKGGVK